MVPNEPNQLVTALISLLAFRESAPMGSMPQPRLPFHTYTPKWNRRPHVDTTSSGTSLDRFNSV